MTSLVVFICLASVLLSGAVFANTAGRGERVLTPMLLFVCIEIFAVWPTLVPGVLPGGLIKTYYTLITAAVGLVAFIIAYTISGGNRSSLDFWRDSKNRPTPEVLRGVHVGLIVWVTVLVLVGVYRFGGVPPLLSGGLGALVDTVSNSGQVDALRETRRELTKGHTVMNQEYAGQGILNALTETGWQLAVVTGTLLATWVRSRAAVAQAVVVGGLAFVFLGSTGVRSSIILAAVGAVAVLAVRYRAKVRHMVVSAVGVLGILLFIMPLTKGETAGTTLASRLGSAFVRISEGNGQNNAHIVDLVDRGVLDMGWGSLFMERLMAMIPGPDPGVPFSLRLTTLAYGGGANVTGYSTPTQFGLLYADGGTTMVIIGYVLSGIVVALLWRWIGRGRRWFTPVLLAQGAIALAYISVTGIHGLPPALLMIGVGIFVMNSPVWLGRALRRDQRGDIQGVGTEDRAEGTKIGSA